MEPGSDGPAIFYPELRQNHLALAFTNQRWMQEVVMLEPYIVFAWCPAYYVWPYCMFPQVLLPLHGHALPFEFEASSKKRC